MHKTVKLIARFAIITALLVVAFLIDTAISQFGLPVKIAVVTIIVVMTVSQLFDFKTALFTGTMFGLISFIMNLIVPSVATAAFIDRPYILLLIYLAPRILVGMACYGVFRGLKKLLAGRENGFLKDILPRSLGAAAGVLTNTVLVLTMIAVFNEQNAMEKVLTFVISLNFLIEIASGLLIVPAVSHTVARQIKKIRI